MQDGKPQLLYIGMIFFSESMQKKIIPIYKTYAGWQSSTFGLKKWSDLPKNAQIYISSIEELVESDISIISTGPERTQTINKNYFF